MKSLLVVLMVLGSSTVFAGSLECSSPAGTSPSIEVSSPDWSNDIDVNFNGRALKFQLTAESAKTSRYKLPYVVFSKSYAGFQLAVFKVGQGNTLKAHVAFNDSTPATPTFDLNCRYEVSE